MEKIEAVFVKQGFENVIVSKQDTTLIIVYENRRYRFEPEALTEIIELINQNVRQDVHIQFVILHQKIPMLYVDMQLGDYRNFLNGDILTDQFSDLISVSMENPGIREIIDKPVNNSNFKADFVIVPNFRAQFGVFTRPVQSNINLIPELNMLLAKGLTIKSQVIFPVQNNFITDPDGKVVRPGLLTFNQLIRLDDNVFFQATAGFFTANRVGGNIEFKKYFADGDMALGSQLGFTAYHAFIENRDDPFMRDDYFTGLLSFEYRYRPFDVIGRLQAGSYLYNDLAVRFDILRQFGEVNIGFFAMISSSSEVNGGFNFAIPLPPHRYLKPKFFRLRQARNFSWEYRAKGFPLKGINYKTGHELFELMLEYNPDFFKKSFLNSLL
ncbi:MAG: hypothetical protein EOM23_04400 [Candidatus Moranbacteria bacterium]|nr:hypothetical protein [Candidatus Moranbacteria bacterium]